MEKAEIDESTDMCIIATAVFTEMQKTRDRNVVIGRVGYVSYDNRCCYRRFEDRSSISCRHPHCNPHTYNT